MYIDPSVFDRKDLMIFYRGDWKREDALKALKIPDVAFVTWKVDGSLSIQTWPTDPNKPVSTLTRVLGVHPSAKSFTEAQYNQKVSLVDWRIIDVLVDDPTVSLEELTEKTGLSPKTVRKHLQGLVNDETIYIMLRLGSLADSGDIVYHLAITGKVRLSELREVLGEEVFMVGDTNDPPMKYLLCRANNLADATNRIRAAEKLPGIESVEVTLNRELFVATDFVHSLVQGKIKELENRTQRVKGELQKGKLTEQNRKRAT